MDSLLFFSKKIITCFFYPLGTALLCWICGLAFLLLKGRSRVGVGLVTLGGLWLLVMSMPVTGIYLLSTLEADAGPYADPQRLIERKIRFVVVLGGDVRQGDLTAADRVACTSLVRAMEGVRLWRGVPKAKLVMSGGSYSSSSMTSASSMADLAREMGVPADAVLLEAASKDTREEARLLKPLLGKEPFALVTSASHMLRSVMDFRKEGLNPLPAPADFETRGSRFDLWSFMPGSRGLEMSRKAIHEYLGILALVAQTWISGR